MTEESGNTGGVAILFSKDLDPVIAAITPSHFNRFLMVDFSLSGEHYKIVTIYMPTSNREKLQLQVLDELNEQLQLDEGANLFIGGTAMFHLTPLWIRRVIPKTIYPTGTLGRNYRECWKNGI